MPRHVNKDIETFHTRVMDFCNKRRYDARHSDLHIYQDIFVRLIVFIVECLDMSDFCLSIDF